LAQRADLLAFDQLTNGPPKALAQCIVSDGRFSSAWFGGEVTLISKVKTQI
jgi:hypothetical protein